MDNASTKSYTGPRGIRYLRVFVCHGCQTCWEMVDDKLVEHGPHYLSLPEDVTDLVLKEAAGCDSILEQAARLIEMSAEKFALTPAEAAAIVRSFKLTKG